MIPGRVKQRSLWCSYNWKVKSEVFIITSLFDLSAGFSLILCKRSFKFHFKFYWLSRCVCVCQCVCTFIFIPSSSCFFSFPAPLPPLPESLIIVTQQATEVPAPLFKKKHFFFYQVPIHTQPNQPIRSRAQSSFIRFPSLFHSTGYLVQTKVVRKTLELECDRKLQPQRPRLEKKRIWSVFFQCGSCPICKQTLGSL